MLPKKRILPLSLEFLPILQGNILDFFFPVLSLVLNRRDVVLGSCWFCSPH